MDDKKRAKLQRTQTILKEAGYMKNSKHAHLVCPLCKERYSIRTNNPELYTPEVRSSWRCWRCKSEKGGTMANGNGVTKPTLPTTKPTNGVKPTTPSVPATVKVTKPTKPAGTKAPKVTVDDLWFKLFTTVKSKTDDQMAIEMQKLNPSGKKYTAKDVAGHRSGYNNGRLPCQKGIKPKVRVERVEK